MTLRRGETDNAVTDTKQFLVVVCGRTYLALEAGIVRGIIPLEDRDLNERLAALGVDSPATDLGVLFRLAPVSPSSDGRVVVCGRPGAQPQAFRVDRLVGLKEIEGRQIMALPAHFRGSERYWFLGLFFLDQTMLVLVVEPGWLLGQNQRNQKEVPVSAPLSIMEGQSPPETLRRSAEDGLDALEFEDATGAEEIPWAEL